MEILAYHPTIEAMEKAEVELITPEILDDPLCLNMRKGGGINGIEGCRYYIDPITKKKVAYWPNDPTRHQLPEGITEPVTTRTKIKEKRNKKERHAANGRRNWINPIRWIRLNKFLE